MPPPQLLLPPPSRCCYPSIPFPPNSARDSYFYSSHVPLTCSPPLLSPLPLRFRVPQLQPASSPHQSVLRRGLGMSVGDSSPSPPPSQAASTLDTLPFELKEEADFDLIVSPEGLVSICGFGSLLSERSARSTFPNLINFRMAKLSGFRRVFAHVAPIFFERGIASPETKEISSLSVEPSEAETLVITIFEIQRTEVPSFMEREHEFRFLAVTPETFNGLFYTSPAVLCARYSDEEYFLNRCKGREEIFFQQYGRHGIQKIWLDDILPCRVYLRHCVLAAKNLGDMAYDNFLDHTYLGDRKTTIREYLLTTGAGVMEEEPPEQLKCRYGG